MSAHGVHVYDAGKKIKGVNGGGGGGGGGGGVGGGGVGGGGVGGGGFGGGGVGGGLYGTVDANLRGWSGGTLSENIWRIPVNDDDVQKRASEYIFLQKK